MEQKEPGFRWDYAVTSEIDRVFPSKNLEGYWEKENVYKTDCSATATLSF